jgi:hypothetical protein
MTDKAIKRLIEEMKKRAKEANTREKAIAELNRVGICTPTGKLRKPYR